MKKFVILLSLAASLCVLAGCASKSASDQGMSASTTTAAPQDLKGEVSKTK